MSETKSSRPSFWFAVVAVLVAATVWATVAMAAGGSGSSGTSSAPVYDAGPHSMFAASGGSHSSGDCPNMGGDSGSGGSSTTPSTTPSAPTTPSTQNGSSNPGL